MKLSQEELLILNRGKGNQHTIPFLRELGWKLKESQQNEEYFTGRFTTRNHILNIRTYNDIIIFVEIV